MTALTAAARAELRASLANSVEAALRAMAGILPPAERDRGDA